MSINGFPQASTGGNAANVGDLSQLPTNNKTDIVSAIIEVDSELNTHINSLKIDMVCAETILEGYAVRINTLNQLEKCSAFDVSHVNSLMGLAKQTGNIGDIISVFEDELITLNTWSWIPNKPVYLGLNGTLTQTPTGVAYLQQVGIAMSSTQLVIRISQPFIRV